MSNIVESLIAIFNNFRKPGKPEEDLFDTEGRAVMCQKMNAYIDEGEPIEFVLSAFPAKSPNHEVKTLGHLPDGAEEVAFRNFARFAEQCRAVYAPGVHIRVVTDGLVFADIVGLSEEQVLEYNHRCVEMAAGTPVELMALTDFFAGDMDAKTALEVMLAQFAESEEVINRRIKEDADTNMLYCGLSRFMQTDYLWPAGLSKTQIRKRAGILGKQMLMRSEAYSRFITHHYPRSIRISCHPSTNAGAKYSWQFIPGNLGWNTPWHNALCVVGGVYKLMKRAEADRLGLELVSRNGQPWYYRDQPSAADLL